MSVLMQLISNRVSIDTSLIQRALEQSFGTSESEDSIAMKIVDMLLMNP